MVKSDRKFQPAGFLGVKEIGDFSETGSDFLEFSGIGQASVHLGLKVGFLSG